MLKCAIFYGLISIKMPFFTGNVKDYMLWEQEVAGSNPAIPTQNQHFFFLQNPVPAKILFPKLSIY